MNREKVNSLYLIVLFSGLGLFILYGISNEIRILKNPNYKTIGIVKELPKECKRGSNLFKVEVKGELHSMNMTRGQCNRGDYERGQKLSIYFDRENGIIIREPHTELYLFIGISLLLTAIYLFIYKYR
jgi:hypothetical protein